MSHEMHTGDEPLPPARPDEDSEDTSAHTQPGTARRAREPVEGKPTPRAKWGRVTVELPEYLIDDLKQRALKHRSSLRHIVMKALRTQNFRILDADMSEDARKSNGRKGAA